MRAFLVFVIPFLVSELVPHSFAGETGAGVKPASALLTKEETKEVEAVIASAIAAGFPDATKAIVYSGKLHVSATFDPAKDPMPLPSSASNTQMTDPASTKVTYGYVFDGLHFKLTDGTWLIALSYGFKPKPGDSVSAKDAVEIDLAKLTADAVAEHPFNAEKDAAKFLETIAVANKSRAIAELNTLAPTSYKLKLRPDSFAPAIVLLHKAGWPDAAAFSLALGDYRANTFWQLRVWTEPVIAFDPTGAYPKSKDEEDAWRKANPQRVPEPPQTALRRALFRWCRSNMTVDAPEDSFLTLPVAAAVTKAMVDPKDPQGHAARIDVLLASMRLPVMPPENADVSARLQSWEARARQPRMVVSGNGNGKVGANNKGTISMSTGFVAPVAAYEPKKVDLDALIALLGDERPSRFFDFSGPRTLGDNAWRAAAVILETDPRTLAMYPTDKPWTPAERKAAATAVQKWWQEHKKEYEGK